MNIAHILSKFSSPGRDFVIFLKMHCYYHASFFAPICKKSRKKAFEEMQPLIKNAASFLGPLVVLLLFSSAVSQFWACRESSLISSQIKHQFFALQALVVEFVHLSLAYPLLVLWLVFYVHCLTAAELSMSVHCTNHVVVL